MAEHQVGWSKLVAAVIRERLTGPLAQDEVLVTWDVAGGDNQAWLTFGYCVVDLNACRLSAVLKKLVATTKGRPPQWKDRRCSKFTSHSRQLFELIAEVDARIALVSFQGKAWDLTLSEAGAKAVRDRGDFRYSWSNNENRERAMKSYLNLATILECTVSPTARITWALDRDQIHESPEQIADLTSAINSLWFYAGGLDYVHLHNNAPVMSQNEIDLLCAIPDIFAGCLTNKLQSRGLGSAIKDAQCGTEQQLNLSGKPDEAFEFVEAHLSRLTAIGKAVQIVITGREELRVHSIT